MVSIAAEINSQRRRSMMPVMYAPRMVAPTRRTNAPRRQPRVMQGGGQVNWSAVEQAFASTKGAQQKREQVLQKQAKDEAWNELPWYKKGLGMVVGNPVVSNLLKPTGILGTLGRANIYGVESLAKGLEDAPPFLQNVVSNVPGLGGFTQMVDTDRARADDRSFYEKVLSPTSDYGYGSLLSERNPAWYNNVMGLFGDVALDPTTYVTGGATRALGAAAKSRRAGEAAGLLSKVDEGVEAAARAAEAGDFAEVARLSQKAAEQEALARRLTREAAELPGGDSVPLRQGRRARESFIGELAEENPQLVQQYEKQLQRGAERGFNTIKDPVLREAIGLGDPALRFASIPIPKTGKLVNAFSDVGGLARVGMNRAPLLGSAMGKFAPKGLEEASQILSRGKEGDVLKAATTVRIQNLMRRGEGTMESRSNRLLTNLVRSWKGKSEDEIRALFRQAEADVAPNEVNKFFGDLKDLYHRVAGRPMGIEGNSDTYVPHMMTPQFKRYLQANLKDQTVDEYMKAAGFFEDDLLEGSRFLEKSRKLKPAQVGSPTDFEIGGKVITLSEGTIDELNSELARVFSDFKGKAYMDDPVKIGEAYINSISRQAGRDLALDRLAGSTNPLVQEISGPLLEAINARNAWNRSNPIVQKIKEGYRAGERLAPIKPRGERPTSQFDDMLADTLAVEETNAQTDLLLKEGRQFITDVEGESAAVRKTMGDHLKTLRKTLMDGLKKKATAADAQIRRLNTSLEALAKEVQNLGPLTTENMDQLVVASSTVEAAKVTVRKQIKKIQDSYGKKIPREAKRLDKELRSTLDDLEKQTKAIEASYAKAPAALKAEARRRKTALEAPVEAAQKKLDAAEAAVGERPVSARRVHAANQFMSTTKFGGMEYAEELHDTFREAVRYMQDNNIPFQRRVDGRMTPETQATVQRIAHEIEAAKPPPEVSAAVEAGTPESVAPSEAVPGPKRIQSSARSAAEAAAQVGALPPAVRLYFEELTDQAMPGSRHLIPSDSQLLAMLRQESVNLDDDILDNIAALLRGEPVEDLLDIPGMEEALAQPLVPKGTTVPDPVVPEAAVPTDAEAVSIERARLNERYKDAVMDGDEELAQQLEDELDALDAEIRGEDLPEAQPPAVSEAPPPGPDKTLTKQDDGSYLTGDGRFQVIKQGKQYRVIFDGDVDGGFDMGAFPSLDEARKEVDFQHEMLFGDEAVEEAAEEVAEEVATPVAAAAERRPVGSREGWTKNTSPNGNQYLTSDGVDSYEIRKNDDGQWLVRTNGGKAHPKGYRTLKQVEEAIDRGEHAAAAEAVSEAAPEVVEEVATPVAAAAEPAKPKTRRITTKWETKNVHGRDIEVGRDGWQIESYEESFRPSGPERGPVRTEATPYGPMQPFGKPQFVEPQGPRRPRYVAINQGDDALRGRSFTSAREAKLAVEEHLRKKRARLTMEEYKAQSQLRRGSVFMTQEGDLSGVRVMPPTGLTPEEAAANIEAAATVPKLQRPSIGEQIPPAEYEYTDEGKRILQMRDELHATGVPYATDATVYEKDYAEWMHALDKATTPDATTTPATQRRWANKARSLGAEFEQTTGKHYQQYSARKIIAEDAAWQDKIANSPAVQKAQAEYDAAVAAADQQMEALVYTKQTNILGQESYTRAPNTSMGFGPGEERVAALPKPPSQGEVPTGTLAPPPVEQAARQTAEQRARDRALLDSDNTMLLSYEDQVDYGELSFRSDEINERIKVADQNAAELERLDKAAKAAYGPEIKAADEAVLAAKRKAERTRLYLHGEREIPLSLAQEAAGQAAYADAKAALQEATDHRNQLRAQLDQAERDLKDAVDRRDKWTETHAKVTRAEQAIFSNDKGERGTSIVEAVRAGEPVQRSNLPGEGSKIKGVKGTLSAETQKLIGDLRAALDGELQARDAGIEFITDTDRRALIGELNAIDAAKREIMHTARPGEKVKRAQEILPQRSMTEEAEEAFRRPGTNVEAYGFQAEPQRVPPVRGTGQTDLEARAYAESFNPTVPEYKQRWQLNEEGEPRLINIPAGAKPYEPGTEREAIQALLDEAEAFEKTPAGSEMDRQITNLKEQTKEAVEKNTRDIAESETLLRTQKDEALLPLRDQAETLKKVDQALNDKQKLIPERQAAQEQRKVIVDHKVTKKADMVKIADDIEAVAKQNVDLLDDDLATVEALLQDVRNEAERVTDNDLTAKQVQGAIDKVVDPRDHSLDIMLTTTGRNWKMLYDAYGSKKALLSEGDIILQADLHKMFSNLYDISKDRVLFGRTLNAFTNLFKTYATLTPGFHIRNAISAVFMNTTDGVPLKTQLKAAGIWREYMKAEDPEKWLAKQTQQVRDAFDVVGGTGGGGRFTEAGFAEIANEGGFMDKLERLQRNKFTRLSQRAGERVEGSVRLAMALDSMMMGEGVEAAIQRVDRIHFDYGQISRLDENAKRLIPFWTFMSRNMPMQVSQMWTHPKVYQIYDSFVSNMSAENEEWTPEYWTKAGAFNTGLKVPDIPMLGGAQGLPIYLSPDLGFTRLESDIKDLEDFLSWKRPGGVLSNFNPLLTAPAEFAFRKDIFTGQTFEKGETVPVGGVMSPVNWIANAFGQGEGGEVDAAFMNMLRAVNPLMDRTTRLAPQITGGDPEGRSRQLESILRVIGGAPVRTLTPKQQQNELFRQYYDKIDAMRLMRARATRQLQQAG